MEDRPSILFQIRGKQQQEEDMNPSFSSHSPEQQPTKKLVRQNSPALPKANAVRPEASREGLEEEDGDEFGMEEGEGKGDGERGGLVEAGGNGDGDGFKFGFEAAEAQERKPSLPVTGQQQAQQGPLRSALKSATVVNDATAQKKQLLQTIEASAETETWFTLGSVRPVAGLSEEELEALVEKVSMVRSSLARVLKKTTRYESIFSLLYDTLIRQLKEPEVLSRRGKLQMTNVFEQMLGFIAGFCGDPLYTWRAVSWMGLRHVHYGVQPEQIDVFGKVLINSLEQMLGEQWNEELEEAWFWALHQTAGLLQATLETMITRVQSVTEDWTVIESQLGVEAFVAKLGANLSSLQQGTGTFGSTWGDKGEGGESSKSKRRGRSPKRGGRGEGVSLLPSRAEDLTALLQWLVQAINDLPHLRGCVHTIGVPWASIMKRPEQLPNLKSVAPTVLRTVAGVIGDTWTEDKASCWQWLLQMAVDDQNTIWCQEDMDALLESWHVLLLELKRQVYIREFGDSEVSSGRDEESEELPENNSMSQTHRGEIRSGGGSMTLTEKERKRHSSMMATQGEVKETEMERDEFKEKEKENGGKIDEDRVRIIQRVNRVERFPDGGSMILVDALLGILFEASPTMRSVFVKNGDLYADLIEHLLRRIIAYADDPGALWTDDQHLALDHINFGMSMSDLPLFGASLMNCLAGVLGENWCDEWQRAWEKAWQICCQSLSQYLRAGAHPLTRALLRWKPSEVLSALCDAPRGQRAEWACQVDVNGEKRSPIVWAIQSGHTEIARILLRDVLAIRRNRSGVYYGAETFWRFHGSKILDIIAANEPSLFVEVLDGHVWCSNRVVRKERRVIYYVKELWGDPYLQNPDGEIFFPSLFSSLLAHVVRLKSQELASHPVVTFLVKKKWEMFGRNRFVAIQIVNVVQAVGLAVADAVPDPDRNALSRAALKFVVFICCILMLCISVGRVCIQVSRGYTVPMFGGRLGQSLKLPIHLTLPLPVARLLINTGLAVCLGIVEFETGIDALIGRPHAEKPHSTSFNAAMALFGLALWFMAAEFLFINRRSLELVEQSFRTLRIAFNFIPVFTFIILGATIYLSVLAKDDGEFHDFASSLGVVLTVTGLAWSYGEETGFGYTIEIGLLLTVTLMSLLLVNVLFALIARAAYEMENGEVQPAFLRRAEILMDIELSMHPAAVHRIATSLDFETPHYLDSRRQVGAKGGLVMMEGQDFVPPSLRNGGTSADRTEVYISEEGPEVPWPAAVGQEAAGEEEDVEQSEMEVLMSAGMSIEKKGRALTETLSRAVRMHGHYPYMPQPGPTYVAQASRSAVASHNHNAQSATYVPHTGNTAATQIVQRGAALTNVNAAGNSGEAAHIRQGGAESNTTTAGEANQNGRGTINPNAGKAIGNGTGNNPNSNHPHAGKENLIGRENYAPISGALPHTTQESALMNQGEFIQIPSTPEGDRRKWDGREIMHDMKGRTGRAKAEAHAEAKAEEEEEKETEAEEEEKEEEEEEEEEDGEEGEEEEEEEEDDTATGGGGRSEGEPA
uniref:Globin domain-containing protein n=1 Tax=Chromera velia CCMP2878 TaxID=1169474 RepID=A0A0G4HHE4_9ALVE|eukprot:Cvel_6802.t1-p1 / transcript=Cvel_6802.t1 / gene=Cvel_6802 / organism=Chromera_velia_CCMP2878 / gene_product=hypothetical protein / transcript_product=hypothetical protein / location=Cvel_scaffold342:42784-73068(-) / protein_length=1541 / sequence_SO=supercontig / SO=protein_coding / is_pseudo=false